jgi:1-acyl-sn-glycerol-3-phosphate acyltransferase
VSFYLLQGPAALAVTLACAVAALGAALLDRSGRATRRIGGVWGRAVLRLLRVEVRVRGAENVPRGPAVYAANHSSTLDILIVFGHLPVDFRIVHKRSVSWIPVLGWAIVLGGHVPIDRSHPFRARRSLARAAARIRSGTSVAVFPEGTRSPDGRVRRFKRGSFALALEAGVPVVPVSLAGVKDVVPHGIPSVRPGRVDVVLHPAIDVTGRGPGDAEALAEETRTIVESGVSMEAVARDPMSQGTT